MDEDIIRLADSANRLRSIGLLMLFFFGPPSAFLFVGTMIALALRRPVALRAIIVFPILAFVVIGTGTSYVVLARVVKQGSRRAVVVSLGIATSLTILALLDIWRPLVEDWIVIVRIIISLANLILVSSLIRALGPARRVEEWLNSTGDLGAGHMHFDEK
jgi:hypothetical protein